MTDILLDKAVEAAIAELDRQHQEDRAGTPWVDADNPEDAIIDGRVNLKKVIEAALDVFYERLNEERHYAEREA